MSKKLLRKIYSLILVFIMISGLVPGLKTGTVKVFAGTLPDGAINASVFDNAGNTNATGCDKVKNSTDFNIAWDGGTVGGQTGYLSYNSNGVFIGDATKSLTDTNTHYIRIDANNSTVSSFKLISIPLYFNSASDNFNVTIAGSLPGGGSITYNFGNIVGGGLGIVNVGDLSTSFANNSITGFEITYSTPNSSPISDLVLNQFVISNAQAAPSAPTKAATGVSSTSATLNGTVNANNADTTVSFQYGTTSSYGTTVTACPATVTGNSDTAVSASISGLSAGTTYHYRVAAVNSNGTTYGSDETFIAADPTVLTASSGSSSYIEGLPVAVDSGITLTSGGVISSATVSVTGNFKPSEDALAFTNTNSTTFGNITAVYTLGTGILTLTSAGSTATLAQWQAALRAVNYNNSSDDPDAGTRTMSFIALDTNGNSSSAATKAVTIAPVNNPPTLTLIAINPSFTARGSAVALFNCISISTVEAGQNISSINLTVSELADGSSEKLGIDGTNVSLINGTSGSTTANGINYSVAVSGSTATVNVTKSGGLSVTEAQNLLNNLTYSNSSANPSTGSRTVTLTSIQDNGGTSNGGVDTTSLGSSSLVNVAAAPGAPAGVTATAGDGKATVSFTSPVSNGGSPITQYTVTANPGGKTATGNSSPITVTGLTNGTAYTFTVTARNAIGTGAASGASNAVTPRVAVTPSPSSGSGTTTETVQLPVTVGTATAIQLPAAITTNSGGSVSGYAQFDGNSAAAAIQSAVSTNAGYANIMFPASLIGSSYTAGFGIPSAAAAQFSGSNIGLNISTPDAEVGLAPGVLGSLTGSSAYIYINSVSGNIADAQSAQLIGIYAPGAQRLTSGINITGNLSQPFTITLPVNLIRTSAAGEANTASDNLAVLAQYSDGTSAVERGTVTYDANGNPAAVSLTSTKLGTFTVIKLPGSSTEGNKTVIPYKVNADKAWQLGFSENIDASTVDKDSVYVTDESGNKAVVKLTVSDNVLTITPVNNYISGKTYDLYIGSKVSGKEANSIGKAIEYEFTIVQ